MAKSKLITKATVITSGHQDLNNANLQGIPGHPKLLYFLQILLPLYKFCHKVERKNGSIFGPTQKDCMYIVTLKTGETWVWSSFKKIFYPTEENLSKFHQGGR